MYRAPLHCAAPCPLSLLAVDGVPAESLTLDETTTLLRGPAGSSVTLLLAPAGPVQRPPRLLELERAALPQPAVKVRHTCAQLQTYTHTSNYVHMRVFCGHQHTCVQASAHLDKAHMLRGPADSPPAESSPPVACRVQDTQLPLPDGRVVQYVRLAYFSHEATSALAGIIAAAEGQNAPGVAGYVLDLRNDPGGTFEEAVAMAALFEVRALTSRTMPVLCVCLPTYLCVPQPACLPACLSVCAGGPDHNTTAMD